MKFGQLVKLYEKYRTVFGPLGYIHMHNPSVLKLCITCKNHDNCSISKVDMLDYEFQRLSFVLFYLSYLNLQIPLNKTFQHSIPNPLSREMKLSEKDLTAGWFCGIANWRICHNLSGQNNWDFVCAWNHILRTIQYVSLNNIQIRLSLHTWYISNSNLLLHGFTVEENVKIRNN